MLAFDELGTQVVTRGAGEAAARLVIRDGLVNNRCGTTEGAVDEADLRRSRGGLAGEMPAVLFCMMVDGTSGGSELARCRLWVLRTPVEIVNLLRSSDDRAVMSATSSRSKPTD